MLSHWKEKNIFFFVKKKSQMFSKFDVNNFEKCARDGKKIGTATEFEIPDSRSFI